ncbi:MAG: hypothetical protein M1816_001583 [Peltula sp. TS41687]|nr:MAG: hypothetical protein M1816_001583 [Peltula sp. TS41687]
MATNSTNGSTNGHSIAAVYDNLGARYEEEYGDLLEQHLAIDWLLPQMKPNGHALDIGSGTGRPVAARLTKAGHKVTGLDVSETMVRLARENVPSAEFRQLDVRAFSAPPQSFDAVCACFSLLQIPRKDIRQVIRNVHTWLRNGGWFLFATVPGDVVETKQDWLGQVVLRTTMPLDDYLDFLREVGFEIRRCTVSHFQLKDPGAELEEDVFIHAQKISKD